MKHIKRIALLLLALTLAFSLTACVNETYTVNISSKGGSATHKQVISEEVYDQLISMGSDLDELKDEGYTITFFEEDGIKCVKATKNFEFKNLNELERFFQELATSDEGANSEKYFEAFTMKSKGNKIKISGIVGKPDASTAYSSCIITLKFDGSITKHTIGEKEDAKTLKLDLMDLWKNNSGEEFTIIAGDSFLNLLLILICIISVAVITIVTIVIVLVIKKKNKIAK
ncbi:MAG: hypothetical protein IJA44_05125 [Clostridia bacterium]|nr:hypothetical protein [Clostridia bacterium]